MTDSAFRIYHNARCSKSRAACSLLAERGLEPEVVDYLRIPPTVEELRELARMLGLAPSQLVRRGEDLYRSTFAGRDLTEDQWLVALAEHPILLERPILVRGNRAVVGRPPERVLELL